MCYCNSIHRWLLFAALVVGCAYGCGKTNRSSESSSESVSEVSQPEKTKRNKPQNLNRQEKNLEVAPQSISKNATPVKLINKIVDLGGKFQLNNEYQVWALDFSHCFIRDQDLEILYSLPEIRTLCLRSLKRGGYLANNGLKPLQSLRKLERLDLSYNSFKIDLSPLQGHSQLSFLDLIGSNRNSATLNDASLKVIATLPNLKELKLGNSFKCTEEGVQELSKTPIELLDYEPPSRFDIAFLGGLKQLRQWRVLYDSLPSNQLGAFEGLTKLNNLEIHLSEEAITEADLSALASMKSLEVLYIGGADNRDWSLLSVIHKLPNLKSLQLGNAPDEALDFSQGSESLEILCLRFSDVATKNGFFPLRRFHNLRKVSVDPEVITADAFESIGACKSLRGISFSTIHTDNRRSSGSKFQFENISFDIDDMRVLFEKPNFQELNLYPIPFGDELFDAIRSAENLKSLNLSGSKVTNQGVAALRHFPDLEFLGIDGTNLDRELLQKLHDEFFPRCYISDIWCCGCLSIDPIVNAEAK